ncbi:hypothetical protein BD410DRAFT_232962 [Rickenella mellea]|uniref:Uncharacterized protein n=1 Tax=Rickenella mellea TaxID=50990 RepID=A0A4Y7QMI0_9AGAM|nr:hypothetical protein BD410DRAFT_232962 [Rickenella mellea]
MTLAAAQRHELSASHGEKVEGVSMWEPQPDFNAWMDATTSRVESSPWALQEFDKRRHVDALKDSIPFWREQIEAADRGVEIPRWEDFLERFSAKENGGGGWDDWGTGGGWGADIGRVGYSQTASGKVSASSNGKSDGWSDGDGHSFVDEIAFKSSVSEERRQEMHAFYKMSTDEKVSRIQELVYRLHEQSQ